jgi:diphthine synthase
LLTFIGLGTNPPKSLTIEGIEAAKASDHLYLETHSSPTSEGLPEELGSLIGKEVRRISRVMLEDGKGLLNQAKQEKVSLFVLGDPMVATTHSELQNRAIKMEIDTQIIHSSSIISSIVGETGLQIYKFGKITTATRESTVPLLSLYITLYENLLRGLHTLILLEYDESENFFLSPSEALLSLLEAERDQRYGFFSEDIFTIVCSKIGMKGQSINLGTVKQLMSQQWTNPPYSIIIPGNLHFEEEEALKTLAKKKQAQTIEIPKNTEKIQRKSKTMIGKYVPKTLNALQSAREQARERNLNLEHLFENVELYASDAQRFLNEGKEELAILSIGYAEGLLDSLRFSNVLKLEW